MISSDLRSYSTGQLMAFSVGAISIIIITASLITASFALPIIIDNKTDHSAIHESETSFGTCN